MQLFNMIHFECQLFRKCNLMYIGWYINLKYIFGTSPVGYEDGLFTKLSYFIVVNTNMTNVNIHADHHEIMTKR